jgi:hypothetical protein
MMRSPRWIAALGGVAVMAAGAAAQSGPAAGTPPEGSAVHRDVERARAATAAFRSLDSAVAAGYARTVPRCLSHAQHGAMGYHHANRALMDGRVQVDHPEILIYTRSATGEYLLNGVEYIVPYSVRPRDSRPPRVMGQELKPSDGLQLWYLHVWIWTENPAGMFADFNPALRCPAT